MSEFRKILPNENCIFFGDTKNMPYGEKTKEQLLEFSTKAFKFFEKKEVKAVVMACNTTSAVVYEELKDKFNFKVYPLIQSVAKIIASSKNEIIGIFATPATINSQAYSKWINLYNEKIKVIEISCPDWVKIVENNQITTENAYNSVKNKMHDMMQFNPDKIILGCTHYPYLIDILAKFAKQDLFINPATDYVNFIKNDLYKLKLLNTNNTRGTENFYVSSFPEKFIQSATYFYNVKNCDLIIL